MIKQTNKLWIFAKTQGQLRGLVLLCSPSSLLKCTHTHTHTHPSNWYLVCVVNDRYYLRWHAITYDFIFLECLPFQRNLGSPQETLRNCHNGEMGMFFQKRASRVFLVRPKSGEHYPFVIGLGVPITSLFQKKLHKRLQLPQTSRCTHLWLKPEKQGVPFAFVAGPTLFQEGTTPDQAQNNSPALRVQGPTCCWGRHSEGKCVWWVSAFNTRIIFSKEILGG